MPSVSQDQQKFFNFTKAVQEGKASAKGYPKVEEAAKEMKPSSVEHFVSHGHIDKFLPKTHHKEGEFKDYFRALRYRKNDDYNDSRNTASSLPDYKTRLGEHKLVSEWVDKGYYTDGKKNEKYKKEVFEPLDKHYEGQLSVTKKAESKEDKLKQTLKDTYSWKHALKDSASSAAISGGISGLGTYAINPNYENRGGLAAGVGAGAALLGGSMPIIDKLWHNHKVNKYMKEHTKEAFDRGFFKAALDNGVKPLVAVQLLKQAIDTNNLQELLKDPRVLGALGGGAIGGIGGAMSDEKHRGRNALIGGLGGAGLGALGGQMFKPEDIKTYGPPMDDLAKQRNAAMTAPVQGPPMSAMPPFQPSTPNDPLANYFGTPSTLGAQSGNDIGMPHNQLLRQAQVGKQLNALRDQYKALGTKNPTTGDIFKHENPFSQGAKDFNALVNMPGGMSSEHLQSLQDELKEQALNKEVSKESINTSPQLQNLNKQEELRKQLGQ